MLSPLNFHFWQVIIQVKALNAQQSGVNKTVPFVILGIIVFNAFQK